MDICAHTVYIYDLKCTQEIGTIQVCEKSISFASPIGSFWKDRALITHTQQRCRTGENVRGFAYIWEMKSIYTTLYTKYNGGDRWAPVLDMVIVSLRRVINRDIQLSHYFFRRNIEINWKSHLSLLWMWMIIMLISSYKRSPSRESVTLRLGWHMWEY